MATLPDGVEILAKISVA